MFKGKHINCTSEETWQGPNGSLINYEACIKHVAEIKTHEKSEHGLSDSIHLCSVYIYIHIWKDIRVIIQ